jgi:hypothetical protein
MMNWKGFGRKCSWPMTSLLPFITFMKSQIFNSRLCMWEVKCFIPYIQILPVKLHTTECPTRYRTRHFFNNFTTNEDIATKFEADLPHCVRNVKEKNVLLFKFSSNIFIGFRIIKEMPGLVVSGTPCIFYITQPFYYRTVN